MSSKPFILGVELHAPNNSLLSIRGFNIKTNVIEDDISWIASKGFNGVRIMVYWSDIESTEGILNWAKLDNVLSLCQKYNIYAILDFHQWHYSPYFTVDGVGVGFPKWLVAGGKYTDNASGRQAFSDELYQKLNYGATSWTKFVDFWKKIVTRYKSNPYVVAYEIINEPMIGASHADASRKACGDRYKEIIPIIRAIDPYTIIICHYIDTNFNPVINENTAWTRSAYKYDGTTKTTIDSKFNTRKTEFNTTMNAPFFISETGVMPADQSIVNFLEILDDEYRAILNNGSGIISYYVYAKGTSGGYQGARNSDGTDSFVAPVLQTWLQAQPQPPLPPPNTSCQKYIDEIALLDNKINTLNQIISSNTAQISEFESNIHLLEDQIKDLQTQLSDSQLQNIDYLERLNKIKLLCP